MVQYLRARESEAPLPPLGPGKPVEEAGPATSDRELLMGMEIFRQGRDAPSSQRESLNLLSSSFQDSPLAN